MRRLALLFLLFSGLSGAQCTFTLNPTSASVGASLGTYGPVTMTVTSGQNCSRTVTANAGWIGITYGASGTGGGSFGYSVDANTTASSRVGTITAAGQTFTVTQAAPDCITLTPSSASFAAAGGNGTFTVAASGCNWTAVPDQSWIHITANPNGYPGSTTVSYSVDANTVPTARSGSIPIGTSKFTVSQAAAPCTGTLSASSASVAAAASQGSFTVTGITQGCTLSALPNVAWITALVSSTTNTVTYNISANPSTQSRTGTIAVLDKTFTIAQAGQPGCSFTLTPTSAQFTAAGGSGSVAIATTAGCAWTAASNADWATASTAAGTGPATFSYTVAVNTTGTARNAALTIGGVSFSIAQAPPDANAVLLAGIRNAASYQGGAVAPGEFVVLFGFNIGPPDYTYESSLTDVFDKKVASTRALFDGQPAALYYVGKAQSAAIVPYAVYGQSQTKVQVEYQGTLSNALTLDVAAAAPGIFTQPQNGSGAGAILNQDSTLNTAARPAARGSIIMIFATGEGQTNPAGVDGLLADSSVLPAPLLNVTATVGGVNAPVKYAGAAPGEVAGVLQVNVLIPDTAPTGAVPLIVQVGNTPSQTGVTVAVQ